MRLVNFLFALYAAFLVCYPCTDEASHDGVLTAQHVSQDDAAGEEDPCSPFCVCQCCSAQIYQPTYFSFTAFCPDYSLKHEAIVTRFSPSVSKPIWQPPKEA